MAAVVLVPEVIPEKEIEVAGTEEQVITLLDPSTQRTVPALEVRPARLRKESASVVILMSPTPPGVRVMFPEVVVERARLPAVAFKVKLPDPALREVAEAPVVLPMATVLALAPVPKFKACVPAVATPLKMLTVELAPAAPPPILIV